MRSFRGQRPFRWVIGFVFVGCLFLSGHCFAADTLVGADAPFTLDQMEQKVFSHTFENDSETSRLDRLESTIYGAPKKNLSDEKRLDALDDFFQSPAQQRAEEAATVANKTAVIASPTNTPGGLNAQNSTPPLAPADPSESQYPTVTAMEQRVFNQTYAQEPIENRLGRLESRVLGGPQGGSLQDRTDHLASIVLSPVGMPMQPFQSAQMPAYNYGYPQQPGYGVGAAPPHVADSNPTAMGSPETQTTLAKLEKKVLRKTYPQDPEEPRLDRLEQKLFSATAPEMSDDQRITRIASVVNAKQSEGNPFANGKGASAAATFGPMILMILMSLL